MVRTLAILALLAVGCVPCGDEKLEPKATLVAPADKAQVNGDESFAVKAKVTGIAKTQQVWVCIEVDTLLWPKEKLQPVRPGSDEWSGFATEGGSGKTVRLTLILVDAKGIETIDKWFKNGQAKNEFPGLTLRALEAQRLSSIELRLK